MNLYDRLKDKRKLESMGKLTPTLYSECEASMKSVMFIHDLTLKQITDIYWMSYPNGTFSITRFYNLFELID
jgi:hypothetical protein